MKLPLTGAYALAAAAVAAQISWQDRRPLPEGVAGGAIASFEGEILYAGGTTWRNGVKYWLSSVHRYDIHANSWSDGPALPEALAYGAFVQSKDSLEILGGMNGDGASRKCWRLDRGASAWVQSGSLSADSLLAGARSVGGHVYLVGGCPDVADLSKCTDAVLRRDASGKWVHVSTVPGGPAAIAAIASVGDRIYLFGGCAPTGPGTIRNLDHAYSYAASTGQWHHLRSLPVAARSISAVALDDRFILLAGGYTASQDDAKKHGTDYGFTPAAWIYDTVHDTYERMEPLPLPVAGMEFVMHGAAVFGIGGEDRMRGRSNRLLEATLKR
jgi:N-acetylneuraminic acid mutarotase